MLYSSERNHSKSEKEDRRKDLSEVGDESRVLPPHHPDDSDSILEDVRTAYDDTSSLKLDLGPTSDRQHSVVTPRPIDSARTLADISEECPMSAPTTARDESSIMGVVRRHSGTRLPSLPTTPRHASVASTAASYSEDFSSIGQGDSVAMSEEKRKSSEQPKDVSQRGGLYSEESVPTEDDVSEAALSDSDDGVSDAVPLKINQLLSVDEISSHSLLENGKVFNTR